MSTTTIRKINDKENQSLTDKRNFERKNTNKNGKNGKNEINDFKYYCMKVIVFKLDTDRNINEQFEYFRKMCELTSKNNSFKINLSIDNYMVIMNKVIERYNDAIQENNPIIINFYWDIMINFIASVKSIYKNILYKEDGPKYINEKSINFSSIIKKCCVSKNGNLKYKNQIKGFLNMTRNLVGWSVDDRRIIGNWLKEMDTNKSSKDETDETNDEETEDITDEKEEEKTDETKEGTEEIKTIKKKSLKIVRKEK